MDEKQWNEMKSILFEIRENVLVLAKEREKELITPKEVCELCKFSKSKYRRFVQAGVIKQIRIGKSKNAKVYVERSEIERLINAGKI